VVVTVGKIPTKLLLKKTQKHYTMKPDVGKIFVVDYMHNFKVIPCWHPSYVLRRGRDLVDECVTAFKLAKLEIKEGTNGN
jgi:uracil-DNA glycosylase